uniref:NADH-ubiquinone oxidoreductase chain 2 n=1 Tax=Epiophlebia superstes TaxID=126247 RepID=V9IT37_9ODON|nr:NADH dehydrogenase subunit 2 [Epiophlebia superstes]AFM83551.1 NADH dehydrogenase subunit 2 [Epiophlebia superstes]
MVLNMSSLLFSMSLVSGTLITISSTTWIGAWMGLEMNLLSFIPLMNKNKNPLETESAMKYFLVQAIASIIILLSILLMMMKSFDMNNYLMYPIASALLMKMGAAPFHYWFPSVMTGMTWMNCFILMTWQKIAPFILLSYKICNNYIFNGVILMNVLVGAIGGLNQSCIRKLMAYSSISHIGWMISAMIMNNSYWLMYFIFYSIMNVAVVMIFYKQSLFQLSQIFSHKNNSPTTKFSMFISMLSLGGLPPFLGFLPKWMIIQNMINSSSFLTITVMVMTTLVTLYFYLRIMFSSFTFLNQELYWKNMDFMMSTTTLPIMISIMGIPMIVMMY